jgi:hypothetical protein
MHTRLFLFGLIAWSAATATLRFGGQRLLHPDDSTATLILFAASFPLMAWLVCRRFRLGQEQWLAGAYYPLLNPPTIY